LSARTTDESWDATKASASAVVESWGSPTETELEPEEGTDAAAPDYEGMSVIIHAGSAVKRKGLSLIVDVAEEGRKARTRLNNEILQGTETDLEPGKGTEVAPPDYEGKSVIIHAGSAAKRKEFSLTIDIAEEERKARTRLNNEILQGETPPTPSTTVCG